MPMKKWEAGTGVSLLRDGQSTRATRPQPRIGRRKVHGMEAAGEAGGMFSLYCEVIA